MNIITVIPITRSKVAPELSYFTASDVPVGAIVTVPLRSKAIHAVVSGSRPAADLKAEIKSAPFEIRKLGAVKASAFFPAAFLEACAALAEHYAATTGAVLRSLVSETVLESAGRIPPPLPVQASLLGTAGPSARQGPSMDETCVVQGDDADRLSAWRSLVRQEFARKRSVAFHLPTAEDARQLYAALEKGIEGYIFMFHPGMTAKKVVDAWRTAADTDHPVVIVASGPFAVLPRGDIDSVVIERENGRGWVSKRAPYVDMRHAIETAARRARKAVYLADILVRAETLERLEAKDAAEGSPFKWRSISTAKDALVDMRAAAAAGGSFRALSPELEALVAKNIEENTRLFILASRRGLSPVTVCDDCQTIVSCRRCAAPVVLHAGRSGANFFLCHVCGERRSADETCSSCGGWRLSPLGVGIELVEKELKERFPGLKPFKVDADSTATEARIADALARFKAKPGGVLIGTEVALSHIADRVEHAAVASLDSLFALPDFRVEERIMYALARLRSLAERTFIVQTRRSEERVFEYALKGNLSDFYRSTAEDRKKFGYPPYETLIKITLEGKKEAIAKEMGEIQALASPREVDVFPAFTAAARGNSVIHGLIKVPRKEWPDHGLVAKLRLLPPRVTVKIDPESLL
ncbi:MAG: hypothetical protein KGI69_02285 [Patescibacteria group bacterium]|nr:hypothetical protein [Patescibacteria group bacterium]